MLRSFALALWLPLLLVIGCGGTPSVDGGMPGVDGGEPDAGNDAAIEMLDAALADDAGPDGGSDVGPSDAGPSNQCTNVADMPIAAMSSTGDMVASCGSSTLGAEPGLMNCIVSMTGLSATCASCYDGEVHCVIAHCLAAGCATAPMGASCTACRVSMCHPAFMTCSGLD